MTPSYTFRPQRNAGGYDVILFGTHSVVDVVPTRFKAEQRVRELNQYARNVKFFKRDESVRGKLTEFIKDEIVKNLKKVKHGQKAAFWINTAEKYGIGSETLRELIRQHRREQGL